VELTARVLRSYLIPRYEIEQFIAELRAGGYEMFRRLATEIQGTEGIRLHIPDAEVATVRVSDHSILAGLSLLETVLRSEYGVTLLAILREGKTLTNPSADTVFCGGDRLIVFGKPQEVANAAALARGVDG
jgi:CPA2 family monovalent cation:H+ antiporter-2